VLSSSAGINGSKDLNFGYNALTGEYEDLVKAGVLDPTKVVRTALNNAGSIAALMLTTEALVADIPEEKKGSPAGGPWRHGRHVLGTRHALNSAGRVGPLWQKECPNSGSRFFSRKTIHDGPKNSACGGASRPGAQTLRPVFDEPPRLKAGGHKVRTNSSACTVRAGSLSKITRVEPRRYAGIYA